MQLRHLPDETTWEAHGSIRLLSSDGTELASHPNFQHNRNFRSRDRATAELMADLAEAKRNLETAKAA